MRGRGSYLVHGKQNQVFGHNDVMEMWREICVHERPYDRAREGRQQMPVVDEDDATFACNNNNNDDGGGGSDGDSGGGSDGDGGGGSDGDGKDAGATLASERVLQHCDELVEAFAGGNT